MSGKYISRGGEGQGSGSIIQLVDDKILVYYDVFEHFRQRSSQNEYDPYWRCDCAFTSEQGRCLYTNKGGPLGWIVLVLAIFYN